MMEFKKYSSIENTYRKKETDKVYTYGYTNKEFCVMEKVHGANLSYWIEDDIIKPARRTGFIKDDNFYKCYKNVMEKYAGNLILMYNDLKCDNPDINFIGVYGELFGGTYNHKDVDKVKTAIKIQKGIFYTPFNDFIVFDIIINDGTWKMLNYDKCVELCDQYKIHVSKPIFKGTFEECINYKNNYDSEIYKIYNLPKIEDNICEGNVIKPIEPLYFPNGQRVIFKNKSEKWKEKANKPKRIKIQKEVIKLSTEENKVLEDLNLLNTENRLRNVISKIGNITEKDFSKLMGLTTQDILKDYEKDNEVLLEDLENKSFKLIKKLLMKQVANLIRGNFINILDGEF